MSYFLGIDLGTTYTAAAVHDGSPQRGPEMITLGERGPTVPSVLWLQPDGRFVAGDAAERHAVTDPRRVARQFKRRLGDPTPLLVGDTGIPAEVLTGQLLRWVVETTVHARGGERPATIVLTHPANWGPYKRDLLEKAAEIAGVPGVVLVTEPQAAAIAYAAQERVDEGAVVAVYDLGGGTFDAAVLRKEADGGFTVLGSPEGIERLGGIDVDAAVFAHVCSAIGDAQEELDPDDPQAVAAVARLREECTRRRRACRSTARSGCRCCCRPCRPRSGSRRGELEALIRPTLAETVTALERALRSAGLTAADVDHVLLVGGSSRIPLVAELVSSGLGRPVAVDAHPKHAIALGAAIVAARAGGALRPERPLPPPPGAPAPAVGGREPPLPRPRGRRPRRRPGTAAPRGAGDRPARPRPAADPAPHPPPPARRPVAGPPARPRRRRPAAAASAGRAAAPGRDRPRRPGAPPGDPSFAEAASPAPPPGGYRGGAMPPPPGQSGDLPPGYLTGEAKVKRQRSDRRRRRLSIGLGVLVLIVAVLATLAITAKGRRSDDRGRRRRGRVLQRRATNDVEHRRLRGTAPVRAVRGRRGARPARSPSPPITAQTDGDAACGTALDAYYGAPTDVAAANGLELSPIAPTEEQWNDGDDRHVLRAVRRRRRRAAGVDRGQGRGLTRRPSDPAATGRTVSRRRPRPPRRPTGRPA